MTTAATWHFPPRAGSTSFPSPSTSTIASSRTLSVTLNPYRRLSFHRHGGLLWSETGNDSSRWLFSVAAASFDYSPPPIDHDVVDAMVVTGAKVSEDGVIETYDNDDEALDAVENGVAVVDLSHFGRIRVSGEDRVSFLHNQTTANFESLNEGEGCDTVFVTPTARTIDIAHAWVMRNAITLVVSPATCTSIIEMLTKYIFFADKVEIQDITKNTSFFALLGPKSRQIMEDYAEYNLVQAVQENANLRSKIVQSPDKLQRALEEKKSLRDEAVQAEKLAKQAFAEKNAMVEVYTKAFKKMTKHYTQMEKIQEQINNAKSIDKDLKLLKAKLTDEGVMDKQLDAKLLGLNGRVDQLEEQKKTVYNESQVKIEEATRTLDIMKQEIESRKQDLETRKSKVAAIVAEAEANGLKINEVKESSKAKQQLLLSKMEELAKAVQVYNGSFWTAVQNHEKSK